MKNARTYYERTTSWALDAQIADSRSRRIAWTLAGIAVAVALFEAIALAMLTPLKSVQTVTLLVDKQTGYVQALDPLTPRRVQADDALTNAYLAQYVTAREGFDRATITGDYRKVALWSTGRARSGYLAMVPATNPGSPFQRMPAGSTLVATVKSVSRLDTGMALVRFDTARLDRTGQRSAPQPWVAIVRFRYVDAPMSLEDRLINPLGFQITNYRRDAEAPPPTAVGQTAPFAPTVPTMASATALSAPVMTTVVETRRSVVRSQPEVTPLPRRTYRAPPPQSSTEQREVPMNRLPLGSPLSPSNAAYPTPTGAR